MFHLIFRRMRINHFFPGLVVLLICPVSFCQDFTISLQLTRFDGHQLFVQYDLVNKDPSDVFHVWLEITRRNDIPVTATAVKGEVGGNIRPGINKKITWVPADDAIFLDEEVSVELIAEKYEKSFNKGSMLLLSAVVPGSGLTRISQGKPWWLAGLTTYGTLTGGFVCHSSYKKSYEAYKSETDPVERADLFDISQKNKNLSNAFFISAAALWLGNMVWVAAKPNHYKPFQYSGLSVYSSPAGKGRAALLSYKINF